MNIRRIGLFIEYIIVFLIGVAILLWSGDWLETSFYVSFYIYVIWFLTAFAPLLIFAGSRTIVYGFVRITAPVLFGTLLVLIYELAHSNSWTQSYIIHEVNTYDGEQYYAVISTLFAILTALILVKGIEAFDRLNGVIGEEANKVRSIVEFMYYFEEQDNEEVADIATVMRRTNDIRKLMLRYCQDSIEDPGASKEIKTNGILRKATRVVGALECHDKNDELALTQVMAGINQLFTIRAHRAACSRVKIPIYMFIALSFMSIAIIFPFFFGKPEEHLFAQEFIFILTAFCTFVLFLLRDINSPFEGFWSVDMRAFHDLRDELDKIIPEFEEIVKKLDKEEGEKQELEKQKRGQDIPGLSRRFIRS
ncbi:MAG: DUF4239 domain-containing protein [Pseudomonadota bacterium]